MSDTVQDLKRMILEQQNKIEQLEKHLHSVERQAEAAEQYTRQDCLILRGKLSIKPNCSLREEVARLIAFHTGVRFPNWCINTVHWLGGGNSIIIRFNNKAVRDEIYRNRIPKDVNKRGLFIHESLTAAKMTLVSRCAGLRKEGKLSTYFTMGGNVLVKRSKEAPSILVSPDMTNEDIIKMLDKQPRSYREAVHLGSKTTEAEEKEGLPEQEKSTPKDMENATEVNKEEKRQKTKEKVKEVQEESRTITTAERENANAQTADVAHSDPRSATDSEDGQENEKHGSDTQGGDGMPTKKGARKTGKSKSGHVTGKSESASNSGSDSDASADGAKGKSQPHNSDKSSPQSTTKRASKRKRDKKKKTK